MAKSTNTCKGGDLGIARINTFNWSAGTPYTGSGVVALCIARPLCDIALPVTGMWSERDLVRLKSGDRPGIR